jgi:heme oxygenase
MSASKGSLHERLRAATGPLHDELERAVNMGERLASRERYADHLVRLWRLHVAAEQALKTIDFSPLGFTYPSPYRSRLLEQDIADLRLPAEALSRVDLPPAPALDTIPAALGCLYVVEGSAKGARAIVPEINAALGLNAERGASFFYGFGRETGHLWRASMAAINAIDPDSIEGDAAVRAAVETFVMFHDGLVGTEALHQPVSLGLDGDRQLRRETDCLPAESGP